MYDFILFNSFFKIMRKILIIYDNSKYRLFIAFSGDAMLRLILFV